MRPYPSITSIPSEWKNSSTSSPSGAAPDTPTRSLPAEPLLHLGEDEPLGDAFLQSQQGGHRLALAPEAAGPAAHADRPESDRALRPALAVDLAEHVRVDLLVHARDRRQDRRMHRRERVRHAHRLGAEGERRAVEGSGLVGETPEAVRQRQEEEDDVAVVLEPALDAHCGGDEVLVRQHAALRRARRAGRVDQRAEVAFGDLGGGCFGRIGMLVAVGPAFGFELGQLVEAHDLAQRRQPVSHRRQLGQLLVVLGEGKPRLGVLEDVRALLGRARRVEAHHDGPDRHRRPVEQHPLEAGAGEYRDGVAAAHPAGEQSVGEDLDPLRRLRPGHGPPAVRRLLEVRRGLRRWSRTCRQRAGAVRRARVVSGAGAESVATVSSYARREARG